MMAANVIEAGRASWGALNFAGFASCGGFASHLARHPISRPWAHASHATCMQVEIALSYLFQAIHHPPSTIAHQSTPDLTAPRTGREIVSQNRTNNNTKKRKITAHQQSSLTRASGNKAAFSIGPSVTATLASSDSAGYRQPTPGVCPTDITGVAAYIVTRRCLFLSFIRQDKTKPGHLSPTDQTI